MPNTQNNIDGQDMNDAPKDALGQGVQEASEERENASFKNELESSEQLPYNPYMPTEGNDAQGQVQAPTQSISQTQNEHSFDTVQEFDYQHDQLGEPMRQQPIQPQPMQQPPAQPQPMQRPLQPMMPPLSDADARLYRSCKSMSTVTLVCAFVSLVVGGVLLSSVALVLSIVYMRKTNQAALRQSDERLAVVWELLGRSLKLSMVVSAISLLLNVTALILFYPMLMELMQSGDLGTLFGPMGSSSTGRNPVWG